jgi:hypothetical protein
MASSEIVDWPIQEVAVQFAESAVLGFKLCNESRSQAMADQSGSPPINRNDLTKCLDDCLDVGVQGHQSFLPHLEIYMLKDDRHMSDNDARVSDATFA